MHGVREEIVAEMLHGLPAVPFQRTRLHIPRGWGRLAKGSHSKLHGKVEVVCGDGGGEGPISADRDMAGPYPGRKEPRPPLIKGRATPDGSRSQHWPSAMHGTVEQERKYQE